MRSATRGKFCRAERLLGLHDPWLRLVACIFQHLTHLTAAQMNRIIVACKISENEYCLRGKKINFLR